MYAARGLEEIDENNFYDEYNINSCLHNSFIYFDNPLNCPVTSSSMELIVRLGSVIRGDLRSGEYG